MSRQVHNSTFGIISARYLEVILSQLLPLSLEGVVFGAVMTAELFPLWLNFAEILIVV